MEKPEVAMPSIFNLFNLSFLQKLTSKETCLSWAHKRLFNLPPQFSRLVTQGPAFPFLFIIYYSLSVNVCVGLGFFLSLLTSSYDAMNMFFHVLRLLELCHRSNRFIVNPDVMNVHCRWEIYQIFCSANFLSNGKAPLKCHWGQEWLRQ